MPTAVAPRARALKTSGEDARPTNGLVVRASRACARVQHVGFGMTRITIWFFASALFLGAQTAPKSATEPPPQASFGLQDATIIKRLAETKPAIGKGGAAPRLADGKPDLSGPWEPNAIRENVSLAAAGVQIPFRPEAKAIYDQRLSTLGKDDPEARC